MRALICLKKYCIKDLNIRNTLEERQMIEEYKTSPNMKKFFDNLLDIKEFVKEKYEDSNDEVLKEVYAKLDSAIKLKKPEDK